MQITLSDFLQKFYPSRADSVLAGCGAKWRTASFFFENALREDTDPEKTQVLPGSQDGYSRWINGTGNPSSAVYSLLTDYGDEDCLMKALMGAIRPGKERTISDALAVTPEYNEQIDKRRLSIAITKQFFAIIRGYGRAELCADAAYKKRPEAVGLNTYLHGAIQKYKWMTILGGLEAELDEYYVCNRIGRSPAVIAYLDKGNTIDDATLRNLRTYDKRGITNRVLLIAASGFGKTLMLQHLFLEAARTHMDTGLLPVLIELRDFSHLSHNLVDCIVASVTHFGESFSEKDARDLLAKGQCQILLDGLDEMDPSEITEFQRMLTDFVDRYPDTQIVISSRECDALNGIRRFNRLYIHPFDNDQSHRLIDRLLCDVEDPEAKQKIRQYMDVGFIKKDGVFATNPMLLTFVVQNYQKLDEYSRSQYLFYQEAYEAILIKHDGDKNAFERIFHSVSSVDEFTLVFREFCALSYLNSEKEFSKERFENYFNRLKSVEKVENPSKLKWRAFLQDACATACMMYEESSKIIYIDPAFQEYLFALYMYQEPFMHARALLRPLKGMSPMEYQTLNGFHMFYEMGAEKAEIALFLPFLELIFRGSTEDEAFEKYLLQGYSEIGVTVLDRDQAIRLRFDENGYVTTVNEPGCIPLLLILREKHLPETFFAGTSDLRLWWEDCSIHDIAMGSTVVGHVVKATQDMLAGNADRLRILAEMLKRDAPDVYNTFLKVKEYYTQIVGKRRALIQTETGEEDAGWRELG